MKSAGFPHKKFLFSESNVSSYGPRKIFLDMLGPQNKFPDNSLGCRVSSETNDVIIRHIDPSILHKTSAKSKFSNLVLVPKANFEVSNVCQNVQKWLFLKAKFFSKPSKKFSVGQILT